jgi:hypothetical protein
MMQSKEEARSSANVGSWRGEPVPLVDYKENSLHLGEYAGKYVKRIL